MRKVTEIHKLMSLWCHDDPRWSKPHWLPVLPDCVSLRSNTFAREIVVDFKVRELRLRSYLGDVRNGDKAENEKIRNC